MQKFLQSYSDSASVNDESYLQNMLSEIVKDYEEKEAIR